MPALFDTGFFVRKPAWHGLGTVLDDFPGREEAMRLAGHDFEIVDAPVWTRLGTPESPTYREVPGYKQLVVKGITERHQHQGSVIAVVKNSYTPVQNSTCWDVIDAIIAQPNVNYETGATLNGGAQCFVTAWLDEPGFIEGDDSPTYPYAACNWAHDGSGAVKVIGTSVREVCANTVALAESEAAMTGREFTFRHTKNVMEKIEDAKMAIRGISEAHMAYMALAEELAKIKVTPEQRREFVTQFIPTPPEALISARVRGNIEEARARVTKLLVESPTVPDAHRLTGYGLLQAGIEYLDHVRGFRNTNTYLGRTLLRPEPLKAKLVPLIKEVALA